MKIELDLTEEESKFLLSFVILRPIKTAASELEDYAAQFAPVDGVTVSDDNNIKYDMLNQCISDLDEAGPIYENLRTKMTHAIRKHEYAKQDEAKNKDRQLHP